MKVLMLDCYAGKVDMVGGVWLPGVLSGEEKPGVGIISYRQVYMYL